MPTYKDSILITGGTSGVGLEAARRLAKAKPDTLVVITGRTTPSSLPPNTHLHTFDLTDSSAITALAETWPHPPVTTLLLNAGLALGVPQVLPNGIECTFGVNHVGNAAVLFALLAHKRLVPDAHVIIVTSALHMPKVGAGMGAVWTTAEEVAYASNETEAGAGAGAGEDGQGGGQVPEALKNGDVRVAYSNSKLANIMFAYALGRRVSPYNTTSTSTSTSKLHLRITAFSPGWVPTTGLFRPNSLFRRWMLAYVIGNVIWAQDWWRGTRSRVSSIGESGRLMAELVEGTLGKSGRTQREGEGGIESQGETSISPSGVDPTGGVKYYRLEKVEVSSEQSRDIALQDDLWEWTVQALGVDVGALGLGKV